LIFSIAVADFRWYRAEALCRLLLVGDDAGSGDLRVPAGVGALLFADFDAAVRHIVAQLFLLKAEVAGALRKHVPDYLLATDTGPLVADVKPRYRAATPDTRPITPAPW
jgi:hypothetical protein